MTDLLYKILTSFKLSNITLDEHHVTRTKTQASLFQLQRWRRVVVSENEFGTGYCERLSQSFADCPSGA